MDNLKIAILDIDSIAFAIGWGNKIPDPEIEGEFLRDEKGRLLYVDKTEQELIDSADYMMTDILYKTHSTHYIGYIKGKNTAAHRYQAKSDYKSNRPKESPKWWNFVKGYLTANYNIHEVNDIEVDDAVNITKITLADSFIIAVDKDLLHLEGTHYNWRTGEWVTTTKEQAEIEFWADMIVGQPGDGVKGIPGKGKAYANKLNLNSNTVFNEYIKFYGEHYGIVEFYKNYTCLKILEEYEGFEIPNLMEFTIKKEENGEDQMSLW